MSTQYTDMQLDALRELANIGSGTASTALSRCSAAASTSPSRARSCCRWPTPSTPPATPSARPPASSSASSGDMPAWCCCSSRPSDAELMCGLLGVEAGTEIGDSALREIGNIVGTSYINALAAMTGMELEPTPPRRRHRHARRDRRSRCWPSTPAPATSRCCSTPTWSSRTLLDLVPARADQGGVDLLARLGLADPSA